MERKVVGVLGGGQLGRMMSEACHRLGIELVALDPLGAQSPCGQVCHYTMTGNYKDAKDVNKFVESDAVKCDVLTVEIEHVDAKSLDQIEKNGIFIS